MNLDRYVWLPALLIAHFVHACASDRVASTQSGDALFLDAADVAAVLGYQLKIVRPDRLITFCTDDANSICIPVRLKDGEFIRSGKSFPGQCGRAATIITIRYRREDTKCDDQQTERITRRSACSSRLQCCVGSRTWFWTRQHVARYPAC